MYVEMFPVNGKISKEFFLLELSKLYTENIYDLKREENVAKSCQIDKSARQKLKLWSLVPTKLLWTWASFFLFFWGSFCPDFHNQRFGRADLEVPLASGVLTVCLLLCHHWLLPLPSHLSLCMPSVCVGAPQGSTLNLGASFQTF